MNKNIEKMLLKIKKHSPNIMIGMGICGAISSTILAVKSTPKALILIEDYKKVNNIDECTKKDIIKACWKCYIPSGITCLLSIGFIIGANSINIKRNTLLTAAYSVSEKAFKTYKNKVIDTIGEKKEKEIRDDISKDYISNTPINNVIVADKGSTLCFEPLSGRYFKSDIETIRKSVNILNSNLLQDNYVSVNEFYDLINLPLTDIGNIIGWNSSDGLVELHFSSHITSDGNPCLVINYYTEPKYNYEKIL